MDQVNPDADAVKDALLQAARRIFVTEGLNGLSVRRVAQQAGTTTMAVYSRFDGKDGIVGALFDEGFAQLARAQAAVDADLEPRARVVALCRAYRRVAQDHPHHYALMLGSHSGEFRPNADSHAKAMATLTPLVDAVVRAVDASRDQAEDIARRVIAYCHGWVALEQVGLVTPDTADDVFVTGVQDLLRPPQARRARRNAGRR